MTNIADIVVIGAGVQGASLAYYLARAGAGKIVLLEKTCIAGGPTGKSGAMIRPLFKEAVYIQLVQEATTVFENWDDCVGGDAGFVQEGFLRITRALDASTVVGDLDLMQKMEVPVEIVPAEDLGRYAPTGEFTGDEVGVLMPRGGYADPILTTRSLAAAAQRHGVEVVEGVGVVGIDVKQGRVAAVETDAGRINTRLIVNCAGAWYDRVAAMVGIQLPIEVRRVSNCLFRKPETMLADGPIMSDGINRIALLSAGKTMFRSGLFSSSPDPVDPDTYEEAIGPDKISFFRDALQRRYAGMRQATSFGGLSALYDMTPDSHPIVGPIAQVEGFWCDCGWSGNGFAGAPAVGRSLAAQIMGEASDIDLSMFGWPRAAGVQQRVK
jgi:sarcosine oxidase subunit beta